MSEAVPPVAGLVRKEINGVTYWFDEATHKVHSVAPPVAPEPVMTEHVEFVIPVAPAA